MPAHVDRLARLYRAIADEAGARVVVDSSKLPAYGYLLASVPTIDLRVVHLLRDPRAVAYSWQREKAQPDRGIPGVMQRRSPAESAFLWSLVNATARPLLGRAHGYLEVRYEDFVSEPAQIVERVLELAGWDRESGLPVDGSRAVRLTAGHSVAGNPSRLEEGVVEVKPDVEWIRGISTRNRAVATAGALPVLRRYGYPLRRPAVR